jgi:hypothetical protein
MTQTVCSNCCKLHSRRFIQLLLERKPTLKIKIFWSWFWFTGSNRCYKSSFASAKVRNEVTDSAVEVMKRNATHTPVIRHVDDDMLF